VWACAGGADGRPYLGARNRADGFRRHDDRWGGPAGVWPRQSVSAVHPRGARGGGRSLTGRRPPAMAAVHRLGEGRRCQPASTSPRGSGRHGRVGLVAEAAQDVVNAADELAGDRDRRPVGARCARRRRRSTGDRVMPAATPGDRIQTAPTARSAVPGGTGAQRRAWCREEWTVTSRPVWRTAWAEEENRRVSPTNAQMTAEPSAPAPYSSAQGLGRQAGGGRTR
jgi:hypothetical protein